MMVEYKDIATIEQNYYAHASVRSGSQENGGWQTTDTISILGQLMF